MTPIPSSLRACVLSCILVAGGPQAHASVQAIDVSPDIAMVPYDVRFNVDINGDGFDDVWFIRSGVVTIGLQAFSLTSVRVQSVPGGDAGTYEAWPIQSGATIGPSGVSPADWYFSAAPFGYGLASGLIVIGSTLIQYGYFPGQDAYLGVELTLADGIHYGYIEVSVPLLLSGGYLKSYGFETEPGVPIVAGATPEPGRMMLLMPVCVLIFFRRRRRALGSG